MADELTLVAEPLSAAAFAPFGQVIARDMMIDTVMELRGGEVFHLNVLSYDGRPLVCDHLNRHHRATQALVALAGRPSLVVVAPRDVDFSAREQLTSLRAFVCDGTAGINLALGTWHWGPYPLMDHVDLVNVQGRGFADDNEVAYLERDLDVVVRIAL
jgi:ureidoglycolate lyase